MMRTFKMSWFLKPNNENKKSTTNATGATMTTITTVNKYVNSYFVPGTALFYMY